MRKQKNENENEKSKNTNDTKFVYKNYYNMLLFLTKLNLNNNM
jgi:hypothetical protein